MDELTTIPLFEGIPPEELAWLSEHSHQERLGIGDYFFRENGPADRFYVVLEGELQVSRTINGREQILGTTPRGIMGGEMALLNRMPSNVTARAILPSRLMVFDENTFRALFAFCPTVGMRILETAAQRTQGTVDIVKQQEKLAALGKLSAGLAHELNNPAAAARRAAQTLRESLPALQAQTLRLHTLGLSAPQAELLLKFQQDAIHRLGKMLPLPPLEQSTREDALAGWLGEHGVADSWTVAAAFVSAGLTQEDLAVLADQFARAAWPDIVGWLCGTLEASGLLNEIEQGTQRISDLVAAIKSYSYMDQAPVQEVNLHQGLESTLAIMRFKLRDIEVVREYDPHLPTIQARGGELNQVWTNLIDNAIDAMHGQGRITLITRTEGDFVMVEIADNGPGIPPEILPRLFEPFFTTKEVGAGTGLGLDTSYRIVQQHRGTIEIQSKPGLTRFIVRLPIKAAELH